MQQCSFSPLLSFTSTADDVRSPGLESMAAASTSCEWGGGQRHTHTQAQGLLHWCCSRQSGRVQVTFKQRNSPPPPSSANAHINLQHTLVLNLHTQSTCVSANVKKPHPNSWGWNKRPHQAPTTLHNFFLICCDPHTPQMFSADKDHTRQRSFSDQHISVSCCSDMVNSTGAVRWYSDDHTGDQGVSFHRTLIIHKVSSTETGEQLHRKMELRWQWPTQFVM